VLWLVDGLPKGQNYEVCVDIWFTSFSLMCTLKENGILAVGTVRISRLRDCSLKTDEGLKTLGRGADDFHDVVHEKYPKMPYGNMLDFVNKWLKGIFFRN
jgi:hypothetical protein